MTSTGSTRWRAAVLAAIAAVSLALAGCNDGSASDPGQGSTEQQDGGGGYGY
ncbi:MAG TPA: hypothetical protein VE645_08985 [Pseudonocardiaceae bacterium]|nr:hypothetical protein [Pseudonocardiaceae bacterium]